MNSRLGILQGRLSVLVDNNIQEFPFDNWKKEFDLLDKIGLKHIEWIVTKQSFDKNPLFTEDLTKYSISSVCADNLIDTNFYQEKFLNENLTPICEAVIKNNIPCITIPLLEDSKIINEKIRREFMKNIKLFGEKYKNLIFSFEFESYPYEILEVVSLCSNFKITYDTGNITSFGRDIGHDYFLKNVFPYVNNVHLKDRNFQGQTVEPGHGDTEFGNIFYLLTIFGYNGIFTIQTQRGESGKEFETIEKHLKFFREKHANVINNLNNYKNNFDEEEMKKLIKEFRK